MRSSALMPVSTLISKERKRKYKMERERGGANLSLIYSVSCASLDNLKPYPSNSFGNREDPGLRGDVLVIRPSPDV